MEKMIKIEKINEEGKLIDMAIPKNLLSMYLNIGWKKQEKKKPMFQPKKEFKIDKKEDLD
nr:MAG TPA: hypothetical protein [Bacteriophage sp.]